MSTAARPASPTGPAQALDADSVDWLRSLRSTGRRRDQAIDSLHALLLKVARFEAARRRPRLPTAVLAELDDLCVQAASDALLAVMRKLDTFRGLARFTTWAAKFAILEVSTRLRRELWRGRPVETDPTVWDRLPAALPSALQGIEQRDLLAAIGRAVREELTERQRLIFQAAVIEEVPIDVLAERLDSNRGAIYKTLHDARRKLRHVLTRGGFVEEVAR
jgi:RNA polymerase sigma-70 factor (ECF subfamily)